MRALVIPGILLLLLPSLLFAQAPPPTQPPSLLSFQLAPGVNIPLGPSGPVFGLGGGVHVGATYRLPFIPLVYISGGLGYDYETTDGTSLTASVTSASIGSGLRLDLLPWLSATAGVSGGYFYSFLNDLSTSGGNPFVAVNASAILLSSPLHVTVGASYLMYLGLYSGLSASIGVAYDLPPSKAPQGPPGRAQPLNDQDLLKLTGLAFEDIYPVFHTYYDTHPLGKVVLSNSSGQKITGIKVSFQIKEFMADPKDCAAPAELAVGESKSIDLFGLFLPTILQTTEKTKTQAKIDVDYDVGGQALHQSIVQSMTYPGFGRHGIVG